MVARAAFHYYWLKVAKAGVEPMEFDPGVAGTEAPIDGGSGGVAAGLVGRDGAFQGIDIGVSALETGSAQDAEFNLRRVQPTGVLGSVVKLQALGDASA